MGFTFDENLAAFSLLKGSFVPMLSSSESTFRRGLLRGLVKSDFFLGVAPLSAIFFAFFAFAFLPDLPVMVCNSVDYFFILLTLTRHNGDYNVKVLS